jgi:hypothetical protein
LAFLGLSIVVLDKSDAFDETYLFTIGFFLIIMSGYFHLILRQLNRLSNTMSQYFAIGNLIGLGVAALGYLIHDVRNSEGFWEEFSVKTPQLMLFIIFILFVLAMISFRAKLMYDNNNM